MFDKLMSDYFESLYDDKPTSDGGWANAWVPVWEAAPESRPAVTAQDSAPVHMAAARDAQADLRLGGALHHG